MLREEVVEHLRDERLLSLGKLGDGFDLASRPTRSRTCRVAGKHFADQRLLEAQIEQLGEDWQSGRAHLGESDLAMREVCCDTAELMGSGS